MMKVKDWMTDALSRHSAASPAGKTVVLGGVATILEGAADDPYFQAVEGQAAALDGLAALIAKQVPRGSTVIDVGANIGLSTILLARMTERVIAFEPSPPNVAFLRRNLERNGISNVEVHAAAASSQPGTLRFHIAQFGAGSHVVASSHVSAGTVATADVPAVTLDESELPQITFIKIDAEGHEPDVLAGARRLLMRDRPLIYSEVNIWCLSAFAGHSPGAFVRKLWQVFEVGRPEADGQISPLPDAYGFLHDMIVHKGGIADLVLRPRAGIPMPSLSELTWPEAALTAPGIAESSNQTLLDESGDYGSARIRGPQGLIMGDIDLYWQHSFPQIDGWVSDRWREHLKLINDLQNRSGITGHIGEIGVFHGKLLLALAHLAQPGSKVTAIDVFDDQSKNIDGAGVGSLDHFKSNIDAHGPRTDLDYAFIKADSAALNAADILKLVQDRGPFRLFSVDGCHTAEHTLNDLLTAQDCLAPGGVIMLDDLFQPHWPGVTEALGLFYSRYVPRVKPFLYVAHKMFFVGHGWHADFLRVWSDQYGSHPDVKLAQLYGNTFLSIFP